MKVDLDIKAVCIQKSQPGDSWLEHDLEVGKQYDVECIEMRYSYTTVFINGKRYNSVYLEFYLGVEKIDIYKSSLFNPYLKQTASNLIKLA